MRCRALKRGTRVEDRREKQDRSALDGLEKRCKGGKEGKKEKARWV